MRRSARTTALTLLALFTACSEAKESAAPAEAARGDEVAAPVPATTGNFAVSSSGGNSPAQTRGVDQVAGADTAAVSPDPGATAAPAVTSMIIRTGQAVFEVDSLEPAVARVKQMAARMGGYVANSSSSTGERNVRQASIELKLPAANWDRALSDLRPLGKLESQQETTEDVGEEYVDVAARTANARRLEERLLALLATRTGKLEDVLVVEHELARVREEIERYDGRLRYLRARAALSTLTVQLHEPIPALAPGGNRIVDAGRRAWDNFVEFIAGVVESLGWLVPLLAIVAGIVWAIRRALRWRAARAPKTAPPPAGPPTAGPPPAV